MTRPSAKHTIARQNGSIVLSAPATYTSLSDKDRYVEYDSTAQRMQIVAVDANTDQELINRIGMLRDDLASAQHKNYTDLPVHDEFVAVVEKYNAWVSTQSLHLDPTAPAPADPPAPQAPIKAPTTDDTTTPPPASTTTPVADEGSTGTDERLTRLLDRLEGTDGVIERSDAHHLALYGDEDHDGLIKDVEVLKADYEARNQEPSFWQKMFGMKSRNNRGH